MFRRRKPNLRGMPSIQIDSVGTKRRHFKFHFGRQDTHHPELDSHRNCPVKKRLHLFRARAGGDIDVLRWNVSKRIPDAAAGKIRDIPMLLQLLHNRGCHMRMALSLEGPPGSSGSFRDQLGTVKMHQIRRRGFHCTLQRQVQLQVEVQPRQQIFPPCSEFPSRLVLSWFYLATSAR